MIANVGALVREAASSLPKEANSPIEQSSRGRARQVLESLAKPEPGHERRRDVRYPFPQLVRLTPLDDDGTTPVGEPTIVAGKHLSERGLGFFHLALLPQRLVRVEFTLEGDETLSLLLELRWSRFTQEGWYESGGQFVEADETAQTER